MFFGFDPHEYVQNTDKAIYIRAQLFSKGCLKIKIYASPQQCEDCDNS